MSEMDDFSLDFSFGGEDNEHVRDSGGSATGTDSTADRVVASLSFSDDLPMRPVGDSPKWTVGRITPDVNREDYETVLNTVYTTYTSEHSLPDLQRICLATLVSPSTVKKIIESKEFSDSCISRGVPWRYTKGLTSQQMLALQVLTDPTDKRPLKSKLKSLEITYPVYRAWMRQPAFSQYMFKITEGMLTDHLPDFNTVLTNKGLAGDLNAIRYINELSGRHDPNKQQVTDLVAIVEQLLNIIQRNVTDPETFQKIAAEFSMTVNSKTSMGEITRGPNT